MSNLSSEHKNLILDLYFGCVPEEEKTNAKTLIASDAKATELYNKIEQNMSVLSCLADDARCPDHLFENTVDKLNQASATSNTRLTELLDNEQKKSATTGRSFWRRGFDFTAVAASIAIAASLYFPTVNNMRYKSWVASCESNMASIAGAVANYANDNQGRLPAVAITKDAPWWRVGYQGKENYSNTRHLWKLVQDGYVQPGAFVCQGRSHGRAVKLDSQNIEHLKDFPHRRYITYSSRLMSGSAGPAMINHSRTMLISDANPVFEGITVSTHKPNAMEFKTLQLCKRLRRTNSINHRGRGQNIMFSDGSVKFFNVRLVNFGSEEDDIFTVRGRDSYTGCEEPSSRADIFFVP